MFERMGSGDDLLADQRVTSPSGSRTSSVSGGGFPSGGGGAGHRPESRTDSESGVSSRYSYNRSRSTSPLSPSRSSSVSSVQDPGGPGRGVNGAVNGDTGHQVNNGHENGVVDLDGRSPRGQKLSDSPRLTAVGAATSNGVNKVAPDKPERKINAKEAINKHRNWFSGFEKSRSGPESVDSSRRTSVNKENKPSFISAAGGTDGTGAGSPLKHPTVLPLSPNHQPLSPNQVTRSSQDQVTPARPTYDSVTKSPEIDVYMANWRKTSPTQTPVKAAEPGYVPQNVYTYLSCPRSASFYVGSKCSK